MTKISIITPVFNGARFIQDAANSVLAQTCRDWEWIIINDGSTDGTAALLAGFTDPRIQVLHQANAGLHVTLLACGEQSPPLILTEAHPGSCPGCCHLAGRTF